MGLGLLLSTNDREEKTPPFLSPSILIGSACGGISAKHWGPGRLVTAQHLVEMMKEGI